MSWLTQENAIPQAERLISELHRTLAARRRLHYAPGDAPIYNAVSRGRGSDTVISQKWFFASLGVIDVLDDRSEETCYLSEAAYAYCFEDADIVPWTNWLGDLYIRLKNACESGEIPDRFEYGPTARRWDRRVGPVVDYTFRDGLLDGVKFFCGRRALDLKEGVPVVVEEEARVFGLKEIVQTIDLDQNDQIRLPMRGIFIIDGGPGVGKTTVALHRIPYLINEHVSYEEQRSGRELFFSPKKTLVVVWKEHLVPYLRRCLVRLQFSPGFPDENVQFVEDWIEFHLRRYVSIGLGREHYRMATDQDPMVDAKKCLTEDDLKEFLSSENPIAAQCATTLIEASRGIRQELSAVELPYNYIFSPKSFEFSPSGMEQEFDNMTAAIPQPRDFDPKLKASQTATVATVTRRVGQLRSREMDRVSKYPEILRRFYQSDVVHARLSATKSKAVADAFRNLHSGQAHRRVIYPVDTYFLLWIAHYLSRNANSSIDRHRPLPRYSHIVIDEGEYYNPLVLRLFAALSRLDDEPQGTMTIVGDLEQLMAVNEGLVEWKAAGLQVAPENVRRLRTNYRSSRRVAEFLDVYRATAAINADIRHPRTWHSGDGVRPAIRRCSDREHEIEYLVRCIQRLRNSEASARWSVAVVLPEALVLTVKELLIEELRACAINSRWAEGEDVKDSVEKVIVTNYESIVGLEFDAVFVAGCDEALMGDTLEKRRSVWVAISRARYSLFVSYVGFCPVFDDPAFDGYREDRPDDGDDPESSDGDQEES